jgi:hypothetical protein
MIVRHVMVSLLIREYANATCSDCKKEASQEPEGKVWVVWQDTLMYCPACARHKGIDQRD